MSGNVQEVESAIKDLVGAAGRIHGSRLSSLLKERVPSWSPAAFDVRSLREFVTTHVPGVAVVDRSGMDVVYALVGTGATEPSGTQPEPAQVDLWRVWVSPNSPYILVLDRENQALRTVPRGGPVGPSEVRLEPPTEAIHREVAKEFLATLPPALHPKLLAALESPTAHWWQGWVRELRGTGHLDSWNGFRRGLFELHLAARLRDANLDDTAVVGALGRIRDSKHLAPMRIRSAGRSGPHQDDLHRVVFEAVQRLSIAELRELRLPVGIVLDVLATSKSR